MQEVLASGIIVDRAGLSLKVRIYFMHSNKVKITVTERCIISQKDVRETMRILSDIRWLLIAIVIGLSSIILFLAVGCQYQSPKECCQDRGGVQMCYHPNSRTQGYIMCKDGHICSDVRCE